MNKPGQRNVIRRIWRSLRRHRLSAVNRQQIEAFERVLRENSHCIDVGANRGTLLEHMVRLAPGGRHLAIEPLPDLAAQLRKEFPKVTVRQVALANTPGTAAFQHVVTNPGYSGLKRRRYDRPHEKVETIRVEVCRLDDLVEPGQRVDLIKIDVEGGELGVLQGCRRILSENRPVIVFEHGLGAADFYGTKPEDIYELLTQKHAMEIFTLRGWLSGHAALDQQGMKAEFELCRGYMYVAVSRRNGAA